MATTSDAASAQRRDSGRARVSDLFGPPRLCDHCQVYGCRRSDLFSRDSLLAWARNESFSCGEYSPKWFRGIEGVRP